MVGFLDSSEKGGFTALAQVGNCWHSSISEDVWHFFPLADSFRGGFRPSHTIFVGHNAGYRPMS